MQTYIDLYVTLEGKVPYDSILNGNEDEMLSYLGVNREDFLEMVFERYPNFGVSAENKERDSLGEMVEHQ